MPFDEALEGKIAGLPLNDAAEALVRGYGDEVYSFLVGTLQQQTDADEAFSMFCEDLWRGLGGFRREASYRTWAYQLARHAASRLRRGDGRRAKRIALDDEAAARCEAAARTTTEAFRRTDVKDKMRALRDQLRPEDKELLVLRIDRGLEWNEIALVLDEDAATLRKRFERLKEKLRTLAERAGLLSKN